MTEQQVRNLWNNAAKIVQGKYVELVNEDKMTEESEFIETMVKAFDYFDVIKKIVECDNEFILKALRKVLDRQIERLSYK